MASHGALPAVRVVTPVAKEVGKRRRRRQWFALHRDFSTSAGAAWSFLLHIFYAAVMKCRLPLGTFLIALA